MKRTIYDYNGLLRTYFKYCRKLSNLHQANKNERRQNILKKHILRLIEKLRAYNATVKLGSAIASLVLGAMVFSPQMANAQSFGAKQINPFSLSNAYSSSAPTFADIDGDGDLDMLSGTDYQSYTYLGPYNYSYEYVFKYYENTGTTSNPVFGSPQDNPFGIVGPSYIGNLTPSFVDLDNDGDFDILYGDNYGDFYFMENIGTTTVPSFGPAQGNPFGLIGVGYYGRSTPTFADLDNDGDLDLLSGSSNGDFFYFENTGTASAAAFGAIQPNPFGLSGLYYSSSSAPALIDLDGDGDFDLLSGDSNGNFQYFENTGNATTAFFGASQYNPFNLSIVGDNGGTYNSKPTLVDLDSDGDLDIVAGDEYGDFSFYRQCLPSTSTISPTAACGYISPSGNFYAASGTYMDVIQNAAGCDSLITINLTVGPLIDQSVTAVNSTICNSGSTMINIGSSQDGTSYYLRDDANDAIIDGPLVGNGSSLSFNTGNITNTTTYNVFGEGQSYSTGLNFDGSDGSDERVQIPGINLANNSFSIEFWAKRSSANSQDHVIGHGTDAGSQGLHMGFRWNDRFTFAFFGNDLDTPNTFTDTDWHHFAGTYDVSTGARTIYVDGAIAASDVSGSVYTGTGNFFIGDTPWGTDEFSGGVDEVRIWNGVRTQTEIQDNMNECLTGSEIGLEAYYQFEDGAGSSTLSDLTANAHDGTLTNMDINNDWGLGVANCATCSLEMTQTATVTVEANPNTATTVSAQTITADLAGAAYQWVDCDNGNQAINGANGQSYTATANGNFAVEVTANGCTATSNCVNIATVSVGSIDAAAQVQVYPNPTNGLVNVTIPEAMIGQPIVLTNTMGQVVETKVATATTLVFNMENLMNGVYFIQVQTENGIISKRTIKN